MKISPAALAAALLVATHAHAACKLVSAEVPVTMDGLRPLVSAKIGGRPVKLLLDSGSVANALDAKVISDLKLRPIEATASGSHLREATQVVTSGVAGRTVETRAVTAPFEFGGATFPGVQFVAMGPVGGDAAGLLGQSFLHRADDEYDFKSGVIRLVKPKDCAGADVAYWLKPGTAYSMAPLEPDPSNTETAIVVLVNGVRLRAVLDTGADTSFITAHAAARAGVNTSDPGVKPNGDVRGIDGEVKAWVGRFASIKIGDEEIDKIQLEIGDSNANDFDLLLGADFFLAHHVYVANSQGKLYFTYSGGPVFRTAAPDELKASAEPRSR